MKPGFEFPLPLESPVCQLAPTFEVLLRKGEVTEAYKMWCRYAESRLSVLWTQIDSDMHFTKGRGSVRVDSHALWPTAHRDSAATLYAKRLWKLISQMDEVEKRPWGQLALRTWARKALAFFPHEFQQQISHFFDHPPSALHARQIKFVADQTLIHVQTSDKADRIKAWKVKLQHSLKAQHSWLRQDTFSASPSCFKGTHGQPTANISEQFKAVRQAWQSVTELCRDAEPDHDDFFRQYGQYIHAYPVDLPLLTGQMFRDEILKLKDSSPGLDGWTYSDFKLLSHCTPWVIDSLCQVFLAVEQHAFWPASIVSGFTTLIPKSSQPPAGPGELRPLTVLSCAYRVWARIRVRQLNSLWQEQFAHKGMWGGRTS